MRKRNLWIFLKNRSNEIRSNEIRIRWGTSYICSILNFELSFILCFWSILDYWSKKDVNFCHISYQNLISNLTSTTLIRSTHFTFECRNTSSPTIVTAVLHYSWTLHTSTSNAYKKRKTYNFCNREICAMEWFRDKYKRNAFDLI